MKRMILERYGVTEDGWIVIDVSVRSVEQLYDNFDRTSPYVKKELDQEFADYLTDCVREIRKAKFIIQISLENEPDDSLKDRVRKSIQNYYIYLKELEMRALKAMFNRFLVLFGLGVGMLFPAIMATRHLSAGAGVVVEVFAWGLTIAAWVSMWEAIALVLLEWHPHRHRMRLYNRIVHAQVRFRVIRSE